MWIPYNELASEDTGFSRIFTDYIDNYSRVQNFYCGNFRDDTLWQNKIDEVLSRHVHRSALVQLLLNQNRDFHCGVKTLSNIDLLLNDNSVAIITGQQVGLFSGPLYTLYKTLTVLKLTEQLTEKYPDYNFVPIFWLESEDHDIEEISSFSLINNANQLIKLKYQYEAEKEDANYGAVGNLYLNNSIKLFFDTLRQSLISTEYSPNVIELFETAYQNGMTFSRAFVHLFNVLLEDSGLVFFDPNNPTIKNLVKPIFENELKNISKTCQLVIEQSDSIEHQYHAQIKPKPINLFMFINNGRYNIEPRTDGFSLKGTRKYFTNTEMFDLLDKKPEAFSPNVVLRPICQDYIFPTLSYVAGPSEVAYFAQLKLLYQHFNIPEPIIYPRASVTIVEERIQKTMVKFNLKVSDFYKDVELLKIRVAESLTDFKVEDLFDNSFGTISETLTSLKGGLQSIDKTLGPALENTLIKIQNALNTLKEKTIAAQKRQHEISLRQLDKVALSLFPNSNLQEREMNIVYFLNKYGMEFLRWLRGEIIIDKFMHQVINIE